jgi:hypothetical protein
MGANTREQQQAELDAAMKNAAFQSKLQSMSEEERKKATAGMATALALGGKGAADAFQSKIMGVAPDKAGQMFIATAGELSKVVDKSADMVLDGSKSVKDMGGTMKEGMRAAQQDYAKLGKEGVFAIIRQGGPLADSLSQLGITANSANNKTDKEIDAALKKIDLQNSEAAQMTAANASLKEFGQAINGIIGPIVSLLTPVIKIVASGFGYIGEMINSVESPMGKLAISIGTLTAAVGAYLLIQRRKTAQEAAGGLVEKVTGAGGPVAGASGGGIAGALKGIAGGLSALANPAALIGLAAVTVAIMGLAKAFEIASPGFENFGKMVKAIFEGFGGIITSVGTAISTVFNGLSTSMLKLANIDPLSLLGIAGAIGAMGGALGLFGITGGLAAISIGTLADGLMKMSTVDTNKLLKVAEAMDKVNASTPSVGQTLKAGFSGLVSKVVGGGESASVPTSTPSSSSGDLNNLASELKKLNSVSADLLKNMKEAVEYARRNVDATKALNGNLFPTP